MTFVGDTYTVAASVTATGLGSGTPSGSVNVSDGTDHCVITLSGGSGSCGLTSTTAGRPKTITATYAGDLDFTGSSDNATHTVDTPAVAVADAYTTNENGFVASALTTTAGTGVLSNDTDADGDHLTAVKISDPAHGMLTLNADGSFAYTPRRALRRRRLIHLRRQRRLHRTRPPPRSRSRSTRSTSRPRSVLLRARTSRASTRISSTPRPSARRMRSCRVASRRARRMRRRSNWLGYVVTNDKTSMFSQQPAISTSGTLTFKTAANANGVATVSVKAQDNGSRRPAECQPERRADVHDHRHAGQRRADGQRRPQVGRREQLRQQHRRAGQRRGRPAR